MFYRHLSSFRRSSKTILALLITLCAVVLLVEQKTYGWLDNSSADSGSRMENSAESWPTNTDSSGVDDGTGVEASKRSDNYSDMLEGQPKAFNEDGESFMCNKGTSDVDLEISYDLRFKNSTFSRIGRREKIGSHDDELVITEATRFITRGEDMNCKVHLPLNPLQYPGARIDSDFDFINATHFGRARRTRFAYVWYATNPTYFCSALISLKMLKRTRECGRDRFPYPVDYILVHSEEDVMGEDGIALLRMWREEGGKAREFDTDMIKRRIKTVFHRGNYNKFFSFLLTGYARVIVLDSDGFALSKLDHLFLLRFPSGVRIAAPQAYWLKGDGVTIGTQDNCPGKPFVKVATILMVIEPHRQLFERVGKHFGTIRPITKLENFDMEIIHKEFCCNGEVLVLPKHYGTLDTEFLLTQSLNKRTKKCRRWRYVQYVHFSGKGKPWWHPLTKARTIYLHEYTSEQSQAWRTWFSVAHDTCPGLVRGEL